MDSNTLTSYTFSYPKAVGEAGRKAAYDLALIDISDAIPSTINIVETVVGANAEVTLVYVKAL